MLNDYAPYEIKGFTNRVDMILMDYFYHPVAVDRGQLMSWLNGAYRNALISRDEYIDAHEVHIVAREDPRVCTYERLAILRMTVAVDTEDLQITARQADMIGRATGMPTNAFVASHYPWQEEQKQIGRQLGVTQVSYPAPDYLLD